MGILNNKYFQVLTESKNYILGHEFEYGYLVDKRTKTEIYLGGVYGDPEFGLIDKNEKWAIIFGHETYLWTPDEIKQLKGALFSNTYDAKQASDFEIDILDDPWTDNPGIFRYHIQTGILTKIKDFPKQEIDYIYQGPKIQW